MKTLIMITLMLVAGFTVQAQSYKVDKSGKIVQVAKSDTTKTKVADKVYAVVNVTTYYIGPKGGIYSWAVSKETGKKYKKYLPKDK